MSSLFTTKARNTEDMGTIPIQRMMELFYVIIEH